MASAHIYVAQSHHYYIDESIGDRAIPTGTSESRLEDVVRDKKHRHDPHTCDVKDTRAINSASCA